MNSLSNGFLYVVGFGWALTECCLLAVAGNSLPILLFLLVFVLAFALLGCVPLSDGAVNAVGAITAALLAVSLVLFSLGTLFEGAVLFGILKLLVAGAFVVGALVAFGSKGHAHSAHH